MKFPFSPSVGLITGEALLSLYPVLIKSVPTDLLTQVTFRLLTTVLVCFPWIQAPLGQVLTSFSTHVVSLLYLVHVWSSYTAFQILDVGVAMTLFYLYPIFNVILGSSVLSWSVIGECLVSLLGVFMISSSSAPPTSSSSAPPTSSSKSYGIVAILVAAFSESLIYLIFKSRPESNPFNLLFQMALIGSVVTSVWWLWRRRRQPQQPPTGVMGETSSVAASPKSIATIVGVNLLAGILGYLLRLSSISQLPIAWYSILSFSGVIFAYLYGWIFYGEAITRSKVMGTLLIVGSALHAQTTVTTVSI